MTAILFLLGSFAGGALWWLSRQGLRAKPWLVTGPGELPLTPPIPAVKIGLGAFIAVAASLQVLLLSAYTMRMEMADWIAPPQPVLLWVNTVVLMLASLELHRATLAARAGDRRMTRLALGGGGLATLLFLAGQLLAWRELMAAGYRPASNPADAFFFLLTGAHGLHVGGGLVAIGRAVLKERRGVPTERLLLSVELCAAYAHFLLLAWFVLFGALAFAPELSLFLALCSAPFR